MNFCVDEYQNILKEYNKSNVISKYFDIPLSHWIKANNDRLKLVQIPEFKCRVLDIGSGTGIFVKSLIELGHEAIATDRYNLKTVEKTNVEYFYGRMVEMFNIPYITWNVKKFISCPIPEKFDLIVSFSAFFCREETDKKWWGFNEWDFFLNNLISNHLNENGRVLLGINPEGLTHGALLAFNEYGNFLKNKFRYGVWQ